MITVADRRMLPLSREIFTGKLLTVPSLPSISLPCPREAHFWYVVPDEVKSASLLNQYLNILSPYERRAISCINGAKLQKGAMLARALVRTVLSRYSQCEVMPQSLRFRKNRYGKPQLVWQHEDWNLPSLHFNISHTSSLVACGVTVDLQVGIDIEEKQRILKHDVLSLARRFFSPSEVEFLHGLTDSVVQHHEFIKLWTLKEAYVKALGRGFSAAPFRNFALRQEAKGCIQLLGQATSNAPKIAVEVHSDSVNLTQNWQFAIFELMHHYASICVEKDVSKKGDGNDMLKLKVWKTVPFVEDVCILETGTVFSHSS